MLIQCHIIYKIYRNKYLFFTKKKKKNDMVLSHMFINLLNIILEICHPIKKSILFQSLYMKNNTD